MTLFYIIPIVIGFSIDIIYFVRWLAAYIKLKDIPQANFGIISIFVLPAWGISGLMYFGKPPEEVIKVWGLFLQVLLLAFCVHLFICIALPYLVVIVCNFHYGRKLLDMNPLPKKKSED